MIERRKYKRYAMPRGTFAILRNDLDQLHDHRRMSIGEIAMVLYKSKTQMVGQVTNMSLGGIAVENNHSWDPAIGDVELDLLMAEQGIYLHNVPFKAQSTDSPSIKGDRPDNFQRAVLRFEKLDQALKNELREMMAFHKD